ncbi:MAG: hypothetical protein GX936_03055 [Clostridiales bacterium]|jgi:hypothetical protein|nr:hypothetical protein [Clostridiales bacterium]
MNNIEAVWQSIISHGGETFYTITGIPFSYTARNGYIKLNNTNRNISKINFEKALNVINPSIAKFHALGLQGPSYIYGIITDNRINFAR